jgi:hypothetical protein
LFRALADTWFALIALWRSTVWVIERLYRAVGRSVFKLNHIVIIDSFDDSWQSTFHRLAYHSKVIVMDLSAASSGVDYETEFLRAPDLASRMVVIHDGHPTALRTAEQHVNSLALFESPSHDTDHSLQHLEPSSVDS